jgi:hypothetical protein
MRNLLIFTILALSPLPDGHATALRAYWTGKSEHVFSATLRAAIRCQYNAAGTLFWRTLLRTGCPGK